MRNSTPGALFIYGSGQPLTKDYLTSETWQLLSQAVLNPSEYAGHSYRIGAATTAAAVGLPTWLIKLVGRWSSESYMRYIKSL